MPAYILSCKYLLFKQLCYLILFNEPIIKKSLIHNVINMGNIDYVAWPQVFKIGYAFPALTEDNNG